MRDKVLSTLTGICGVRRGDRIIVALSGGADSVSLLHSLISLKEILSLEIMAAHLNHNLRGEESLRDEKFVRNLCDEWNVKLFVKSVDVDSLSKEQRKSVELCGREARYDFFRELSMEHNALVATAHTISDAEETMLYNITRGTTLRGLNSIPYKRDFIVRPLLNVTRAEVEEYCTSEGLQFVQDSTNFDEDACSRNKIRLGVIPALKEINSGFDQNFHRLRADLTEIEDFVTQCSQSAMKDCACEYGYSSEKLLHLHPALQRFTLAQILRQENVSFENVHISLCQEILHQSGAVTLPGDWVALCSQGVFRIKNKENSDENISLELSVPMSIYHDGKEYIIREITDKEIYKKFASSVLDYDIIKSGAVLRTRREGDTFTIVGRNITKPLRKLQNELKIPSELRQASLVIADGTTVLWAENVGVSLQGTPADDFAKGIIIEVKRG